jgi:putative phosphoesterase
MKLAVLADIHANTRAFDVVAAHIDAWHPDQVVVAGDVINRGPCPRPCLEAVLGRVRDDGWRVVIGNHEQYVLGQVGTHPHPPPREDPYGPSRWTLRQIGALHHEIARWPFSVELNGPDGSLVRIAHASMRHTQDPLFPHTPDEVLRTVLGKPPPDVFCVGHTHVPFVRRVDRTLAVNAGAVGMPFDQDPRASYAQLEWRGGEWHTHIVRLSYDFAGAQRDFEHSGYLEEAGPIARLMLAEFKRSRGGFLFQWIQRYDEAVARSELTLEASVQRFIDENGLG